MAQRHQILMVEDQVDDAEITRHVLNHHGVPCDLQRVADRKAFEAAIRTNPPAVILCDLNLPGFSGLEAFDIARRVTPATPFIFFSGSTCGADADRALSCNAVMISKDRYPHLIQLLRRLLCLQDVTG